MTTTYNKKSWGHEILCANEDQYSSRLFVVLEGLKTETMYCKKMKKTIFVIQGVVVVNIEGINKILNAYDSTTINPKIIHNISAIKGDATILITGTKIEDGDEIEVKI